MHAGPESQTAHYKHVHVSSLHRHTPASPWTHPGVPLPSPLPGHLRKHLPGTPHSAFHPPPLPGLLLEKTFPALIPIPSPTYGKISLIKQGKNRNGGTSKPNQTTHTSAFLQRRRPGRPSVKAGAQNTYLTPEPPGSPPKVAAHDHDGHHEPWEAGGSVWSLASAACPVLEPMSPRPGTS